MFSSILSYLGASTKKKCPKKKTQGTFWFRFFFSFLLSFPVFFFEFSWAGLENPPPGARMNEEDVIKSVLAGGYPGLQSMMEATPPLPAHSRLPPRHPSGASSSSSSSQASSSSSSQASSSQGSSSSQLAPSLTPSSPPPISPTPPLTLPSNQQPPPSTPPPPQPKEQVQRQSQFQQYPEYLREMFPKVQNMIGTISTNCPLDLRTIALETRNAEYNPKRFSGAILRIR